MIRPNRLKHMLRGGRLCRGLSMMIPSPQIVEMAGRLGFDWVLLDCEHGTMSPESVEIMTMAAEAAGITAIARPRSAEPDDLLEVLERGVAGVQVPHVRDADQARRVVDAVLYHPHGSRGLAARTRPAGYGLGVSLGDYAAAANDELLICIQLEDLEALRRIDAILDVPGIDVLFVGPSDLSQSMGFPGRTDHPEVRSEMERAFAAIRERGRTAGSAGDIEQWRACLEQGVQYLYTHLPAVLAAGSRDYLTLTIDR